MCRRPDRYSSGCSKSISGASATPRRSTCSASHPRLRSGWGFGTMQYQVRLEQMGSRPLAVVRRRASSQELSKVVPDACGAVWNVVRAQQIKGAGRHVALYWDGQINLEVGVEL